MGLTSSLQIGRSALNAASVALQVTGNNFANAATPGYSRQIIAFAPTRGTSEGSFIVGRGVEIRGINRTVDSAIQARLWSGVSHESAANVDLQLLSTVESTLNELSDQDLSSEFSRFFDAWSELSNSPGADGTRSLVVQQGRALASHMRNLRSELTGIRSQIDDQLRAAVGEADSLLTRIADINREIVNSEVGATQANSLRDERDQLITELSTFMDVSAHEQPSGAIDILLGSTPLVLGGDSRGVKILGTPNGGGLDLTVALRSDETILDVSSGSVGSLLVQRTASVDDTVARLDSIATQLIFQVNRIHSAGYTGSPLTSINGQTRVPAADTARALNDPNNATFAALPFRAANGSFNVTIRNEATGATETVRINIDLDGIDNSGAAGFTNDTSVQSIASDLGGIANLNASVNTDGTLNIAADEGFSFSFSEDTSGALAVLGVNTYFTGTDATNIAVRNELQTEPGLLAVGRSVAGQPTDNGTALAMLGLRDQSIDALGGQSITGAWLDAVQVVGARADTATGRADAAGLIRESLEAQRSSISGVSVDEESINLLTFQRQYQGAARFLTVIDELTQVLLDLV